MQMHIFRSFLWFAEMEEKVQKILNLIKEEDEGENMGIP